MVREAGRLQARALSRRQPACVVGGGQARPDDHGLHADGTRRVPLGGGWTALLQAGPVTATLSYLQPGDVERATLPPEVAQRSVAKLEALRAQVTALRAAITRERARLDRMLAEDRSWDLPAWREALLDHPVRGRLARGMIWEFTAAGEPMAAGIPQDGPGRYDRWLLTASGGVAPLPSGGQVRLWHPLRAAAQAVASWRDLLAGWQVPQPARQAFREAYRPGPATGGAASVAGHVCRQWEARALLRRRGWSTVPASARQDGVARRELTAGLSAELCFDPASDDVSGSGLYDYVVSGELRFRRRGGGAVAPGAVPPLAFSEAMRDADVSLRAASIGTDPGWLERAGGQRFGGVYWHRFGFGELGESGEIRRAVLQRLLPAAPVAGRCHLDARYLHVRGDECSYRIHLGSGNVLVSPSDRFLHVPPGRRPAARQAAALPFDDDPVLTAIVGKAFTLAGPAPGGRGAAGGPAQAASLAADTASTASATAANSR